MFKKLTGVALLAANLLVLVACSDEGAVNVPANSEGTPQTNSNTPSVGQNNLSESFDVIGNPNSPAEDDNNTDETLVNIVETAVSEENFKTLVAALQTTGLDAALADESKTYTVFAPTDTAFAELGADTINALLNDTEKLSDILLYHVVPDSAVNAEAAISLAGTSVTMANGDDVAITLDGSDLFINQSKVIVTDITASNGVIHVLDTVLTPPADENEQPVQDQLNIVETAVAAGSFDVLASALAATGLVDTLSNPDEQFTVFAPTDDAFSALPDGTLEALLADPDALKDILLYHVISGSSVDSTTAIGLAGQSVTMANGRDVVVSLNDGALQVNDATVTQIDVRASNGIIHVIDSVLIPPANSTDNQEAEQPTDPEPETPTGTILEIAQSNEDFSTLVTAVEAAGLSGALGHSGDIYTLFAPTNAAFAALGSDTIDALLADPGALRNILLMHVVPGTVVDADTALSLVGFDIQAGNGETLTLTLEDGRLLINGATIIATDIKANNGVIHIIDAVLLP